MHRATMAENVVWSQALLPSATSLKYPQNSCRCLLVRFFYLQTRELLFLFVALLKPLSVPSLFFQAESSWHGGDSNAIATAGRLGGLYRQRVVTFKHFATCGRSRF